MQRMVVKETCARSESDWKTRSLWRNKLPREIDIHRRIEMARKNLSDSRTSDQRFHHLVHFRGYRLLMRKRRYRLYLNLYSGDLYEAVVPHFQNWQCKDRGMPGTSGKVPEEYIWYVFSALVDACLVLQSGSTLEDQGTWEPITHCDLKLENVLLERSDASTVKVSTFAR